MSPWPFDDAPTVDDTHHRVVHLWTTRWTRREKGQEESACSWAEAELLRELMAEDKGPSLATAFTQGHLVRQYARVADRVPALVGSPLPVTRVPHELPDGGVDEVAGELLLLRLPGGQVVVALSLLTDAALEDLPDALVGVLDDGPELPLTARGEPTTLAAAVESIVQAVPDLGEARAAMGRTAPRLGLASEMHSIVYVRRGDELLLGDALLVRRLLGRLRAGSSSLRDESILEPGELNRGERTFGAVRPGASLIAGHTAPVERNVLVSTVLLLGSASLLREARDEAYTIFRDAQPRLGADTHIWSPIGRDPYADEQTRLSGLRIAVAFHVESHLDPRRMISDANLAAWHACLAQALAIPQSVAALATTTERMDAAVLAAGARVMSRNAFVISLAVSGTLASAAILVELLK